MADRCSSPTCETAHPKKGRCPVNGLECAEVAPRTIAHHIREAWQWQGTAERYFHCHDPACDVAYFGDDGSIIPKSRLRTAGARVTAEEAMLCHCFGIRHVDAMRNPEIRDYDGTDGAPMAHRWCPHRWGQVSHTDGVKSRIVTSHNSS